MFATKRRRDEALARMRSVALFESCSDVTLGRLANLCCELPFQAGATILDERAPGSEFFVIIKGLATASTAGRPLATLGPHDFFGESGRLIQPARRLTVVAKTAVQALAFYPHQFSQLLEAAPEVEQELLQSAGREKRFNARL